MVTETQSLVETPDLLTDIQNSTQNNNIDEIEKLKKGIEQVKRKLEDSNYIGIKRQKSENEEKVEESTSEEDAFEWSKYLADTKSTPVPDSVFRHVIPECMCGFELGMKLEVPNHFDTTKRTYWLAKVIMTAAPLILLRYEGFEDTKRDFWVNTLTDDIHPIGWCSQNKKPLKVPKSIQHKEKNWYEYLVKTLTGAKRPAESVFQKKSHPAHYLRAGQYVEVLDSLNPACYWLARINEAFFGRLCLWYEGNQDSAVGELWCYYTDPRLRPVGHGTKLGLTLYPPKARGKNFSQATFGKVNEKIALLSKRNDYLAFNSIFTGLQSPLPQTLLLGMKLEAVHPSKPSCISVATVMRVFPDAQMFVIKMDNLLTPHEDMAVTVLAHRGSRNIFPAGHCNKHNLKLTPPLGYNGKFSWEAYLKYSKSFSVPQDFFQEEETLPVEVGMKLEAVDQENQANICVTTITKVVGTLAWLSIDGDTRAEQIVSLDDCLVFPVGWCAKSGHELQWPRGNTLEQKNRISSLRVTASRQTRLEVLRKGKHSRQTSREKQKEDSEQQSNTKHKYLKGKRGFKHAEYDDENKTEIVDTSIAIVCINRLAQEYNSESSIIKHFHLDSQGRLPTQIVTIDDEDEEEVKAKPTKNNPRYTEAQLEFFSFLRMKPNDLNKAEEEMFKNNLKRNQPPPTKASSTTTNDDSPQQQQQQQEKRSLTNVVAMLRANRRNSRLLEQYKQNKQTQPSPNKRSKQEDVIDLSSTTTTSRYVAPQQQQHQQPTSFANKNIVIPGKGEFEVVEKVLTKSGDKNKLVLKLGRKQNGSVIVVGDGGAQRYIPPSSQAEPPKTNVQDMDRLSNMARAHKGMDEILRNRCNKVRLICKDLPNNPLQWSKKDVTTFVTNASGQKYAPLFFNQEIDGHSLLLLTVQELHHLLGMHLGAASKLHDYIFTLQQLVSEAYQHSETSQKVTSQESDTVKTPSQGSPLQPQAPKPTSTIHRTPTPPPAVHQTPLLIQQAPSPLLYTETRPPKFIEGFKPTPRPNALLQPLRAQSAPHNAAAPVLFTPSNPRFIQIPQNVQLLQIQQPGVSVPQYVPVQYISAPGVHTSFANNNNVSSGVRFITDPHANTSIIQSPVNIMSSPQTPVNNMLLNLANLPLPRVGAQQPTEYRKTFKTYKKPLKMGPEQNLSLEKSGLLDFPSEHPWREQYLDKINVQLDDERLWEEFSKIGTEMILTRPGRRMFPALHVRITGMTPHANYVILMDFVHADNHRYKFSYDNQKWQMACEELAPRPMRVYGHPESPSPGRLWMSHTVDFSKCKLTNDPFDQKGLIILHSMHKYLPRIHVVYWDEDNLTLNMNPHELLRVSCNKTFTFPLTKFIAVTAYQNSQITQLKIAQNPFARGFRGEWRKFSKKRGKQSEEDSEEEIEDEIIDSSKEMIDSSKENIDSFKKESIDSSKENIDSSKENIDSFEENDDFKLSHTDDKLIENNPQLTHVKFEDEDP